MPESSVSKTLDELNARALEGGGEARVKKQHEAGKKTARERLEALFDPHSFIEIDRLVAHQCHDFDMQEQRFLGDGVVIGYGKIHGRTVFAFSQDFTVIGGSLGLARGGACPKRRTRHRDERHGAADPAPVALPGAVQAPEYDARSRPVQAGYAPSHGPRSGNS